MESAQNEHTPYSFVGSQKTANAVYYKINKILPYAGWVHTLAYILVVCTTTDNQYICSAFDSQPTHTHTHIRRTDHNIHAKNIVASCMCVYSRNAYVYCFRHVNGCVCEYRTVLFSRPTHGACWFAMKPARLYRINAGQFLSLSLSARSMRDCCCCCCCSPLLSVYAVVCVCVCLTMYECSVCTCVLLLYFIILYTSVYSAQQRRVLLQPLHTAYSRRSRAYIHNSTAVVPMKHTEQSTHNGTAHSIST